MKPSQPTHAPPELWAGVECTVNRVGDVYHDQMSRNGHAGRVEDLDLFAGLGVKALRYPVLWELTEADGPGSADWSWADARLNRLRELNIRPIVGLVHHGSGPRHTSLISPDFPEKLADYAARVAERFPWIADWTPVNEPLTTARFSGLYGHWFPHGCDERTFARALLTECRATALAMRAVRAVNPDARLIQTDDLGKTFSTPALRYQADFENERRWLTWDLLCGRVDPNHRMWGHLLWCGIGEDELRWFLDTPCPPDVIGVNYYPTSERFIDDRLERYPAQTHGGNSQRPYADVEAVRVLTAGTPGVGGLLREAWTRYGRPLAVTEVHLGCTREEQMRWLAEVWRDACGAKAGGADVRAVTPWALLGSYDWDSLLTRSRNRYEPGVFDVRGPEPRPTALAGMVRQMASGETPDHPVLSAPGWWRRPGRLLYPDAGGAQAPACREAGRPILVAGAGGRLGQTFARLCALRHLECVALTRAEMDAADPASVEAAFARHRPWAVVNAAGFSHVDEAEAESARCLRDNAFAAATLAAACARHGARLLTFSSGLVFDGAKRRPYTEADAPCPLSAYGCSLVRAEQSVSEALPSALVARTGPLFGPWDAENFVVSALRELSAGREFLAADDAVASPTYAPDLVHACLDLLLDGASGVWHLANAGAVTWAEFARRAAGRAGLEPERVRGVPTRALRLPARRPLCSVLGTERGQLLQPLDAALECFFRDAPTGLVSPCAEHRPRHGGNARRESRGTHLARGSRGRGRA